MEINGTAIREEAERRAGGLVTFRPNPDQTPKTAMSWLRRAALRIKVARIEAEYDRTFAALTKSFEADGHGPIEANRRAREFEAGMTLIDECASDVMNRAKHRHGAWAPDLANDWIEANQHKLQALGPKGAKAVIKTIRDADALFETMHRIEDDAAPRKWYVEDYLYAVFIAACVTASALALGAYYFGG